MLKMYMRLIVPMVVVCAVAAGGLAATYAVTKDRIAATDKANEEKAYRAALPAAESFTPVDAKTLAAAQKAAGDTPVTGVQVGSGASGAVGWGVKSTPRGYGGPVTIVVGVDSSGKVTGVSVANNNETPGLGSRAVGPDESSVAYLGQFKGATDPAAVLKLDGITGATKSSRSVKHAVEAALLVYADVLSKGGGSQ
jgi:Na+-translocating ferredoxin:NAD+ oxidoreductase subunit G